MAGKIPARFAWMCKAVPALAQLKAWVRNQSLQLQACDGECQ